MFNYWWLFFGALIVSGMVGLVAMLILRQRYFCRFDRELGFFERMYFERRFYRQLAFSSPEWIRKDRINWILHVIYRITMFIYLSGIIGFLVIALLVS